MRHIKPNLFAVRDKVPGSYRLERCQMTWVSLQTGERIKKGCGRMGLYPFDGGRRCFYCGRYLYEPASSLDAMWFHFRLAREYWRIQSTHGRDFINGVPVPGMPDPLPPHLQKDLSDPKPPRWFGVFVKMEEDEFKNYLNQNQMV